MTVVRTYFYTYSVEGDRRNWKVRMASSQQVCHSFFYPRMGTDTAI